MTTDENAKVLLIESFYGGSHKQLIDILQENISGCMTFTLPAKKWHWRARTSALFFSQTVPASDSYRVLFASSVLNLVELVALRPDLGKLKKILYFHENQLVYPVRKQQDRDFQYGYNQILSCLVADQVVFNSQYNLDSFLSSIPTYMKLIPDHRPTGLVEQIQPKCRVIPFPIKTVPLNVQSRECKHCDSGEQPINIQRIKADVDDSQTIITHNLSKLEKKTLGDFSNCDTKDLQCYHSGEKFADKPTTETFLLHERPFILDFTSDPDKDTNVAVANSDTVLPHCDHSGNLQSSQFPTTKEMKERPLHIVWAHRWEHDKDPESFFQVMTRLHEDGLKFYLSVIGEQYDTIPEIFDKSRDFLKDHILTWGYQSIKSDYYKILQDADVAVSTAVHEFFGVAMLEAVQSGCYPLCPNRLVYPEIFPKCYLYNTTNQLYKMLKRFCKCPQVARQHVIQVNIEKFTWSRCGPMYEDLFNTTSGI